MNAMLGYCIGVAVGLALLGICECLRRRALAREVRSAVSRLSARQ